MRQPLRDASALAVREIDASIRRAKQARRMPEPPAAAITLLEPELIVRESSRPVRTLWAGRDPSRAPRITKDRDVQHPLPITVLGS